jgi:hypothetical protein
MSSNIKSIDHAKKILANEGIVKPELVEEAKSYLSHTKTINSKMSKEKAEKILENRNIADQDKVAEAEEVLASYRSGRKEDVGDLKQFQPTLGKNWFKFNWAQAQGDEDLRKDEESAKKVDNLRKKVQDDLRKNRPLAEIATELGFKKIGEKWTDFMKTDNFKQFQVLLDDIRRQETKEEVDKIWSGESATPSSFAGLVNIDNPTYDAVSRFLTKFAMPVSSEYAKKNYENIEGIGDLAGPMTADAASNLLMAGSTVPKAIPLISNIFKSRPIALAYDLSGGPLATSAGNMLFNDYSLGQAAMDVASGSGTNAFLGRVIPNAGLGLGRLKGKPEGTSAKLFSEAEERVANATPTIRKIYSGKALFPYGESGEMMEIVGKGANKKRVLYTSNVEGRTNGMNLAKQKGLDVGFDEVRPISQMNFKKEAIGTKEYKEAREASGYMRGKDSELGKSTKTVKDYFLTPKDQKAKEEMIQKIQQKLNNGETPSLAELRIAGFIPEKESLANWLYRNLKYGTPEFAKAYLTNMAGRESFGPAGWRYALGRAFPASDFFRNGKKSPTEEIMNAYQLEFIPK